MAVRRGNRKVFSGRGVITCLTARQQTCNSSLRLSGSAGWCSEQVRAARRRGREMRWQHL